MLKRWCGTRLAGSSETTQQSANLILEGETAREVEPQSIINLLPFTITTEMKIDEQDYFFGPTHRVVKVQVQVNLNHNQSSPSRYHN
jgi:hypothetical protein